MNAVKSFSQFITEEAPATAAITSADVWSITIGYINEFSDNIKDSTLKVSNGKFDAIDIMAAIKELRIFCEDKRDGRAAKALSSLSNTIIKSIQPQISTLEIGSRTKYLESGKNIATNRN